MANRKLGSYAGFASGEFIVDIDTGFTLTWGDSGKEFLIDCTAAVAVKLPSPKAGVRYRFTMVTTDSNDFTLTSYNKAGSATNLMYGVFDVGGTAYSAGVKDVLTLGDSSTDHTIGDWVEVICNGTYWYLSGTVKVGSSLTLA